MIVCAFVLGAGVEGEGEGGEGILLIDVFEHVRVC